ncbi:Eco57I restriction-modification methylase domain-containing protein [Armatimonas sp.]|uniref:Eco57I restriction-modification methylase domain-containing protein n=1 Tax=Armatimonas sp. TaxID=1872638 RepID=UPI00374FE782
MQEKGFWWASLRHGGLLIAPARVLDRFPDEAAPPPLRSDHVENLRRLLVKPGAQTELLTLVLERVLGLNPTAGGNWNKQPDTSFSHAALTGEIVRPRRVWKSASGALLPVFVDDTPRLGIGRGRRAVSRVTEWLRQAGQPVALLTNHAQWRIVAAGLDWDAWAESDASLWFEEGKPGPQLEALRRLLGPKALEGTLVTAIQDSRRGQAELSAELGERVRRAVELLIQSHGEALTKADLAPRDIYLAATRIIMRMVVALFAEARDLLPRDNPIYHGSYGLQGLRESLERVGSEERLRHRHAAWPRVIALFSLIYHGSHHPLLSVPAYGGGLFTPGKPEGEGVSRVLAVFENPEHAPGDDVVSRLLELLCKSRVKVRQGGGSVWVPTPVDFSDLSSEYIGILYEGLLDYELRCAEEPVVFVGIGDEPALPLSRLEGMDDKTLTALLKEFKKKNKAAAGGDEEEASAEVEETEAEEEDAEGDETEMPEPDEEEVLSADDARKAARDRARQWALRAVQADGKKPKARRGSAAQLALGGGEDPQTAKAADALLRRVILPGEWFLVRWGGTRKGAGTFYTRPALAVPTVQRTLRPLAYDGEIPRSPEAILALKVCDTSMGSASFLVAALGFLSTALWSSLFHHGWLVRDEAANRLVAPEQDSRPAWFQQTLTGLPIDADLAETYVRSRLKRHVVERCLYGVDLDPLAVELGRLALWVETMDRELPFEFLDHKLQNGNGLIGCWFDRFRDYPALAWSRQTGDKATDEALKKYVEETLRPALTKWITGQVSSEDTAATQKPEAVHAAARTALEGMHDTSLWDVNQQERTWATLRSDAAQTALRRAFDTWCALWFWPTDRLDDAPLPGAAPSFDETVAALTEQHHFFHWELAFPDVFQRAGSGFDAILGNPPWEVQKPNSKEFFSNIDPLYRAYGKQEALKRQQELFAATPQIERDWLTYNANLKSLSNWVKNGGYPFGDPLTEAGKFSFGKKKENDALHGGWRQRRAKRTGYTDPRHPFIHQGSADVNTYKLFLELAHALLQDGGRLGMIVPANIYTDKGAGDLRRLFLNHCRWHWLFGFENREKIFDIDSRFKFCPLIIEKGGTTEAIQTAFMQRSLSDWENAERHAFAYPKSLVERFSPSTHSILEIRSERDRRALEKLYDGSVLLGDETADGWGIQYAREFDMTNDSKLFPPLEQWIAKGYQRDEYGRWLKFRQTRISSGMEGVIRLGNGEYVHEDDIEDIALPLYEGRMIGQFDFSQKGWVSGKGRGSVWQDIPFKRKVIEPQYLMGRETAYASMPQTAKVAFMDICSATNARTMYATFHSSVPFGHSAPVLYLPFGDTVRTLAFLAVCNSFSLDNLLRLRVGGLHLTLNYLQETGYTAISSTQASIISVPAAQLAIPDLWFASDWLRLRKATPTIGEIPWRRLWALTDHERLRLRCVLDAAVALLYGLDQGDLAWILRDCDHPLAQSTSIAFTRQLDPKGFWRVDKEKDPELRHTVLSLVAFADLLKRVESAGGSHDDALAAFCADPDDGGWELPETLRLTDHNLGHDERATKYQPVRERLGERFHDGQTTQDPAESWAECERHARNLLGHDGYAELLSELAGESTTTPPPATDGRGQTALFGGQGALEF